MKLSTAWINEYCSSNLQSNQIVDELTMSGNECELIDKNGKEIIKFDITPNRADCFSIRGISNELVAIGLIKKLKIISRNAQIHHDEISKIKVSSFHDCPIFATRIIKNIDINSKTPPEIKQKLEDAGYKSINIIVDITNYIMLLVGQPLHAYELNAIEQPITVRKANAKETIELLDGSIKNLNDNYLIIADKNKPLSIAGIMGGIDSSINNQTKDILVESANFSSEAIIGRPRMLNLHTEASLRFERGVDPTIQIEAIEIFTLLVNKFAGGENGPINSKTSDKHIKNNRSINLRKNKIKKVLGITIPNEKILSILRNLQMDIKENEFGFQGWNIIAPPYRFDINDECDLIEEIARIYGYNNIRESFEDTPNRFIKESSRLKSKNHLYSILNGLGYSEVINYSFVSPAMNNLNQSKVGHSMDLKNPLSIEMSVMRNSLIPGLINNLMHNIKRQHKNIRIFEVGKTFSGTKNKTCENEKIAGLIYGTRHKEQWGYEAESNDYFDIKGHLETLFKSLNIKQYITYKKINHAMLHPGKSAEILFKKKSIGFLGYLNPEILFDFNINHEPIIFEIDNSLLGLLSLPDYKNTNYYPSSRRDLSILLPLDMEINTIIEAIDKLNIKELTEVIIFDVYGGNSIKTDSKSISLGLIFQSKSRTLTDEEIDKFMMKINDQIQSNFKIKIR